MNKQEMLATIQAKRPDLLAGRNVEQISDTEVEALARMAQDLSLDRIRDLLWEAIRTRFNPPDAGTIEPAPPCAWVKEVFPDYLIFEREGKLYRLGWSILDGTIKLGENPAEVEMQYVEIRSVQGEMEDDIGLVMRLGAARDAEGSSWDVTVCEAGHTLNGFYIQDAALRAAVDEKLFENVDINLFDLPDMGVTHIPVALVDIKPFLVKSKAGWLDTTRHVAGEGLKGIVHFLDSAKQLGKNMLAAKKAGAPIYGLSWDAAVRAKKETVDGRVCMNIYKFNTVDSVDIVTRPAAGGKFNRAVASMPAQTQEEPMKQKLLAAIKEKRPDLLVGKELDKITDAEVETLARMAMEPAAPGGGTPDPNMATKDDLAILRCGMALDKKLSASDLPLPAQARVRQAFENRVFVDADLDKAIVGEKDYLAQMAVSAAGDPVPVAASGIIVGLGTYERACMAVDRLFGLTAPELTALAALRRLDNQPCFEDVRSTQDIGDYNNIPAFRSLREMYEFFTGDPEVTGIFNRKKLPAALRSRMDITSATFTYVLGNTLARRLVSLYRELKYREDLIISVKKPVKDFRTQEAVLVGGFPDLSDVDPEAADYQEIAGVTDEESTYHLGQKGNILTITRKTIINDDLTIIIRLVNALARTARRTHAKYVWNILIDNGTCTDATAMFTALHGNLGSTALSHATALVAYQAIQKFTEKDSGERLGLLDDPDVKPNLFTPVDLGPTNNLVATEDFYYTGAADLTTKTPNFLRGKVNPVILSLLTDTTDWFMMLPSNVAEIIEMGYLNGREDPELFVADSPQSEQVFVADKVRHKIRHEYAGAAIDYRSGYKAEV